MSGFGPSEKGYAMTTLLEESIDKRAHSPLTWLLSRQTFWVFVAAVVAVTALSLATDTFATRTNLFNVTRNFAFVGAGLGLGLWPYYGYGGCWQQVWTGYGYQWVNVCNDYGYGYGY